jgi:hypothetical protein
MRRVGVPLREHGILGVRRNRRADESTRGLRADVRGLGYRTPQGGAVTMPPLLRFIKRAHRILTRMGIPELGYDSEENMYDKNLEILLERLKTVQLYQNAVRGKWLREKKKAAAANRELEAFRQGNKKTWQTKAEASEYAIRQAFEHFFQKHTVKVGMTSHGTTGAAIIDLVTYLTDRSNQLYANDSAVERKLNAEVKEAKLARHHAEQKAYDLATKVRYYEQRYGVVTGEMLEIMPPGLVSMDALAKEADSFPWKRGNPGYLGDYTSQELLNEIESRVAGLERNRICGHRHGSYVCTEKPGHAGTHAQKIGAGGMEWP